MWTNQTRLWRFNLCILLTIGTLAYTVAGDAEVPSESQCRPYIEKALKGLEGGESQSGSVESNDSQEAGTENETKEDTSAEEKAHDDAGDSGEDAPSIEVADEPYVGQETAEALGAEADNSKEDDSKEDEADQDDSQADDGDSKEVSADDDTAEQESTEDQGESKEGDSGESDEDAVQADQAADDDDKDDDGSDEKGDDDDDDSVEGNVDAKSAEGGDGKSDEAGEGDRDDSSEEKDDDKDDSGEHEDGDSKEDSKEDTKEDDGDGGKSKEDGDDDDKSGEDDESRIVGDDKSGEDSDNKSGEDDDDKSGEDADSKSGEGDDDKSGEDADGKSGEDDDDKSGEDGNGKSGEDTDEKSGEDADDKSEEVTAGKPGGGDDSDEKANDDDDDDDSEEGDDDDSEEGAPEEDLLNVSEIPENLRSRDHIVKILRLDEEASEAEITIERSADIVLRDLKRLYENAIKPLETLYKYRDLSNRHFGDPEIFSKPLVLFMGPWSGGKSSLVNYLTGLEFTEWSLRTGAEPSPAYFNILMYGKEPQVLDGTQLAADWTFSGLQKFGQGLEERLRGLRYPSKLLEKVNIVEIPGILEVRKQVSRVFPFNDACQWFIDRADIIFLVYDPSKLDVGPETEAILDQLKGRESQTRILLNKADTVKPEELMRVQSALIWNISPLMSSAQPPAMYTVSLWSMPYEAGAPVRLLQAQERELLRDLRSAVDRRIDNKIASARRFAVRVRNHAKMVDCYLTTYYNHKTIFGNKKLIAEAIIENPQNYHIYEGLSTLTNISRYDLPDPETYRDFFRLNPVYDFQQLSATCTYFRGCPINRLDVAIAYDFPELVGKYKKMVETATPQGMPKS